MAKGGNTWCKKLMTKGAHYDDRDHPLRRIATTRYPV